MNSLYLFDKQAAQSHECICGVDEAGRGPLCGPVCVAAVILNPDKSIDGLNDSKKLTEKRREALFPQITENAIAYNIVFIDEKIIDELNILHATMLGMRKAIEGLEIKPNLALIDGNRCPGSFVAEKYVIKGDACSACIAAASVLAKVSRDRYMQKLALDYPQYMLEKHKGYPTRLHYELLDKYGVESFYRKSFIKNRGYI